MIAEGTPDALKRRVPGGHVRLQFADPQGLESAASALGASARDEDALTLEIPGDGDVFLALTGQPDKERATLP